MEEHPIFQRLKAIIAEEIEPLAADVRESRQRASRAENALADMTANRNGYRDTAGALRRELDARMADERAAARAAGPDAPLPPGEHIRQLQDLVVGLTAERDQYGERLDAAVHERDEMLEARDRADRTALSMERRADLLADALTESQRDRMQMSNRLDALADHEVRIAGLKAALGTAIDDFARASLDAEQWRTVAYEQQEQFQEYRERTKQELDELRRDVEPVNDDSGGFVVPDLRGKEMADLPLPLDGRMLLREDYPMLYAAIGHGGVLGRATVNAAAGSPVSLTITYDGDTVSPEDAARIMREFTEHVDRLNPAIPHGQRRREAH